MEVVYEELTTDPDAAYAEDYSLDWDFNLGEMQNMTLHTSQFTTGQVGQLDGAYHLMDPCASEGIQYHDNRTLDKTVGRYLNVFESSDECNENYNNNSNNNNIDICLPEMNPFPTCLATVDDEAIWSTGDLFVSSDLGNREILETTPPQIREKRETKGKRTVGTEDEIQITGSGPMNLPEQDLVPSVSIEKELQITKPILEPDQKLLNSFQMEFPPPDSAPPQEQQLMKLTQDHLPIAQSILIQLKRKISESSGSNTQILRSSLQPVPQTFVRTEDEPPVKRTLLQTLVHKFANFNNPNAVKSVRFDHKKNLWN